MSAQNQTSQKSGHANEASEWEKITGKTQRGEDTTKDPGTNKNPGMKSPSTEVTPDNKMGETKKY